MQTQKTYYRRHLPHYQPPEATFHVVMRLARSLPREVVGRLRKERDHEQKRISGFTDIKRKMDEWRREQSSYFEEFDGLLGADATGPRWLSDERVAGVMFEGLHYRDGRDYDLCAFTIMPNHVHVVCSAGRNGIPTYKILQSFKRHTAQQANKILHRQGAFWQGESYDHVIRNGEELERTIWYVLDNPVKAGLVESWKQWRWTYMKSGIL